MEEVVTYSLGNSTTISSKDKELRHSRMEILSRAHSKKAKCTAQVYSLRKANPEEGKLSSNSTNL